MLTKKYIFNFFRFSLYILISFILTMNCSAPNTAETGNGHDDKNNSEPVICFSGDLRVGCIVNLNSSKSTGVEYIKWSYKESSQNGNEYKGLPANRNFIHLYFLKATDYDIKLEIANNKSTIITLSILNNNDDPSEVTRINFHENIDNTYSLTLSFNDDIYNTFININNDYLYFDFYIYSPVINYYYYEYTKVPGIDINGNVIPAGFIVRDNGIPILKTLVPENIPQNILFDDYFVFQKEEIENLINIDIMKIDYINEDYNVKYETFTGYLVLTDDNLNDFYIQSDL